MELCGEEVILETKKMEGNAWVSLSWWDPLHQGKDLTKEELETLSKYLGSYMYSRPMGQLGHGLLPDNFDGFRQDMPTASTAERVQQILRFEVSLADALNKLPVTGITQLFRGGWTSAEQLEEMRATLDSGSAISFPWFQSTTSDGDHAYKFLTHKSEPATCANECLEKGKAFPTYLIFSTCRGKDVRKWNAAEQEWLLLPNLRFKVTGITKILNDPWQEWSPNQMAEWLREEHEVPEDWARNGKTVYGPWPDIAAAVLAHSLDGPAFLAWFEKKSFPEPHVHGQWDEYEYLLSDKRLELRYASFTRFRLPRVETRIGPGANTLQYYYNITIKDGEPCPSASIS